MSHLAQLLETITAVSREDDDRRLGEALKTLARAGELPWDDEAIHACAALAHAIADSTSPHVRIHAADWGSATVTDLATSGGPALKSSFLVSTWLAAGGACVPKIATTGSAGGTIDLVTVLGGDCAPDRDTFMARARAGVGFSDAVNFAPLDRRVMRLRRRHEAMRVPALVIASILGKKMAVGLRRFAVELRCGVDSKTGGAARTRRAALHLTQVAQVLGLDVLAIVTNSDLMASHSLGAPLLAWECLRHLGGAIDPFANESGLIWDRSHRQALELLSLCRWWSAGPDRPLDRAGLTALVEHHGRSCAENASETWEMLRCVCPSMGRLPATPDEWWALRDQLLGGAFPQAFAGEGQALLSALQPHELKRWWKTQDAALVGVRVEQADGGARMVAYTAAPDAVLSPPELREAHDTELPGALVLGAVYLDPGGQPRWLDLGERLLVGTLGESGGVLTETVDAFLLRQDVTMDRVLAVHTRDDRVLRGLEHVRTDLWPRTAAQLPDEDAFTRWQEDRNAPFPAAAGRTVRPVYDRLTLTGVPLAGNDVTKGDDNDEVLAVLLRAMNRETAHAEIWEYESHRIWVSVAGGRKTMGALAYFAASVFKTEGAHHVLVDAQNLAGVFHAPASRLHLVPTPALPIHDLLRHGQRVFGLDDLPSVVAGDGFQGWWRSLSGHAQDLLSKILRDEVERDEQRERALAAFEEMGENPLLPRLRLVLLHKDDEDGLAQAVSDVFAGHLELEVRGYDEATAPTDDVWWARYDAILVTGAVLVDARFNARAPLCAVPIVSLTRADADLVPVSRYLLQRARAFHWVSPDEMPRLPRRLLDLLDDRFEQAQRFTSPLEVEGADGEAAELLRRLFTGYAFERLQAMPFDGGLSVADKWNVRADDRPRPYFVKRAPFETVAREYRAYQMFVRGASENFCGRIEWRPARSKELGAIAYTRIGGTEGNLVSLGQVVDTDFERTDTLLDDVLGKVEAFHQVQRRVAVGPELAEAHLERLLPAREKAVFDEGGEVCEGILNEVNPRSGSLQLLRGGRKVNVRCVPEKWLTSTRLYYGRPISLKVSRIETCAETVSRAAVELFPEVDAGPLRSLLAAGGDLDGFWAPALGLETDLGVCHGDLNLDNLMLVRGRDGHIESGAWLIDFALTDRGPVAYDFAKLEVETWTRMVRGPAGDSIDLSWRGLLGLIRKIYGDGVYGGKIGRLGAIVRHVAAHGRQRCESLLYDWLRGVYALNVYKFTNLDAAGKEREQRLAARRTGLLLAAWFLREHPFYRKSSSFLDDAAVVGKPSAIL